MPIRITTQKQINDVRHGQDRCYLCAELLPPKGQVGRRQSLVSEHVIPSALLGPPPTQGAWPVTLWIHKECEKNHKCLQDQMVKVLQTPVAHLRPTERRFFSSHFGLTKHQLSGGKIVHGVSGVAAVLKVGHAWARGMFMALYDECLPQVVAEVTHAPVPTFRTGRRHNITGDIRLRDSTSEGVLNYLSPAIQLDLDDRLVAWGGRITFHCAWCENPSDKQLPWMCFWILVVPGALEWSERCTGFPRPWHGTLCLPQRPVNAAIISIERHRQIRSQLEKRRLFRFY